MVGLEIPVIPVEHQYIVTEAHPDILARKQQGLPEMGVLRESDASYYMREERGGLLLGPYETGAPCCYVDGPEANAKYELFQEDLDRLMPHIEAAINRVPAFGEVGIKKVYNGAIAYTPDGSPIIGPAWGLKNFWLNEGHSFGVTAAGGQGHLKGKIVRIAHCGYYGAFDIVIALGALELALRDCGYDVEPGAGTSAAQRVFSEAGSPAPVG